MFTSRATYHERNIADGVSLRTLPAILEGPNGNEQGVAVFNGNLIRFILREDHAIALCDAIIDSLDKHRTSGKQPTTPTD